MSNKNIPIFPPSTSPISPPAPTLDQPSPLVPTFNQLLLPVPNTNQPHPYFHQRPTPTSAIAPLVPTFDQPPKYPPSPLAPTFNPLVPNFGQPAHFYFKYSFHISMARTKQSARKVTGGHAPRVNLEVLQKKKAKAKAASKKPPLKIQAKDNAVIICLCLIVSEESLQKVKKADVKFMCMTCHWQKTKNDPKPHMVAMLHSFLRAYFPQGDYNFSQLSFNLGTPESMDAYDKAASDLANTPSAYSRVVLFLTTHSDEDRGDLFTGYINKKPVAYKVLPFLQLLLKPLSKIINGANIIFYVCGSVVTNPQSFNGVKEVAQHTSSWLPQSPTSKASWTTPSSKAFLFPVQLRLP
ncbi:hypothetical protein F5141DRAFT_1068218 [Pisolithus sp. B1]|nr:hypothetical protein F5141DRAFT_1068218 [Pisolithus sp. B1]